MEHPWEGGGEGSANAKGCWDWRPDNEIPDIYIYMYIVVVMALGLYVPFAADYSFRYYSFTFSNNLFL